MRMVVSILEQGAQCWQCAGTGSCRDAPAMCGICHGTGVAGPTDRGNVCFRLLSPCIGWDPHRVRALEREMGEVTDGLTGHLLDWVLRRRVTRWVEVWPKPLEDYYR